MLLLALAASAAGEEDKKTVNSKAAEPAAEKGKELIMVELERVEDSRDKRQTEGEADFSNKEVRKMHVRGYFCWFIFMYSRVTF